MKHYLNIIPGGPEQGPILLGVYKALLNKLVSVIVVKTRSPIIYVMPPVQAVSFLAFHPIHIQHGNPNL